MTLALEGMPPADGRALIAVRPESIRIDHPRGDESAPNRSRMVVEQVVYHGASTHFYLRRPGGEMLVAVRQNEAADDSAAAVTAGSEVLASWPGDRNRLLRDEAA